MSEGKEKARLYKLRTESGKEYIIRTELSMLEISNDQRSKARLNFETDQGEQICLKSQDLLSLEPYIDRNKK